MCAHIHKKKNQHVSDEISDIDDALCGLGEWKSSLGTVENFGEPLRICI